MRIVVAITGASGAVYGITLLEQLAKHAVETHLILTAAAREIIHLETGRSPADLASLATRCYDETDFTAPVASGSFLHDGMVVAPCSMKTLAGIASGYAANLVQRAADVTIKERRRLLLLVRETPLSAIHLENMLKLARLGVVIMPPVPAFYLGPASLEDVVLGTTGRVLDLLGLPCAPRGRWGDDYRR
ncbi:MAG: 3-octaprenyl-4-hydroxybenzoate carboxy-lyase [Clostridia bacterium 62_21]|nr:MAG: 3-octaprenyl-4-hydroxybenzoate carboxy-lyase [Clostridia bacterium 62_21]